jgi:hypothetical protein
MDVLNHHIYEYKKGLRDLVLHTLPVSSREDAVRKLEGNNIPYLIRVVTNNKINIFFGAMACISVLERFGEKKLNEFTPEEDFILGIMLGYNRIQQCNRYLSKTNGHVLSRHLPIPGRIKQTG